MVDNSFFGISELSPRPHVYMPATVAMSGYSHCAYFPVS